MAVDERLGSQRVGIHDLGLRGSGTDGACAEIPLRQRRRGGFGGSQERLFQAGSQCAFQLLYVAVPCPGQDQRQQAQAQELEAQRHDQFPGTRWELSQR